MGRIVSSREGGVPEEDRGGGRRGGKESEFDPDFQLDDLCFQHSKFVIDSKEMRTAGGMAGSLKAPKSVRGEATRKRKIIGGRGRSSALVESV